MQLLFCCLVTIAQLQRLRLHSCVKRMQVIPGMHDRRRHERAVESDPHAVLVGVLQLIGEAFAVPLARGPPRPPPLAPFFHVLRLGPYPLLLLGTTLHRACDWSHSFRGRLAGRRLARAASSTGPESRPAAAAAAARVMQQGGGSPILGPFSVLLGIRTVICCALCFPAAYRGMPEAMANGMQRRVPLAHGLAQTTKGSEATTKKLI